MIYRGVDLEKISAISFLELRDYLKSNNWSVTQISGTSLYLFKKGTSEIIFSSEIDLVDKARRIADALLEIQSVEDKEVRQIIKNISHNTVDVIRFRLGGPIAEDGTIPMDFGIDLFNGGKKALLASACLAADPQKYHARLQRGDAEGFINSCRIGQTEYGSFVTTFLCPTVVDTEDANNEGFGRKATSTLIKSLSNVVSSIDNDQVDSLLNEVTPLISGNICEAILQMMPSERGSSFLEVSASWSPKIAAPNIVSRVSFTSSYYERIESIARNLRPQHSPLSANIIARVDGLNGKPDADGKVRGEVVLVFVDESGELIKAKVDLNSDDYQKAWKAHGSNIHLSFKGILHKGSGRKLSQIKDATDVDVLDTNSSVLRNPV